MNYDIVGDVHGYADALERLLENLGYEYRNGAYRHSERFLISVGDLIDRGPDQLRSIAIIRSMIDAGTGAVVMGNHEYNAIGYGSFGENGKPLRIRGSKNRRTHQAFLDAVGGEDTDLHKEMVSWMKTIPLWFENDDLRVIHACWHPQHMDLVRSNLRHDLTLPEDVEPWFTKGTELYRPAEILLKGVEVALPEGVSFFDKGMVERFVSRTAWWDSSARDYRSAVFLDDYIRQKIPDLPMPEDNLVHYDGKKPLFIGHYWMTGQPKVLSNKIACVDFSVAADGVLTSYSYDGEEYLSDDKLSWVSPVSKFECSR